MSTHKCLYVAFVVLYFCSYGSCFNKTKILGIWIVTNTSQLSEYKACPFVKIQNSSSITVTYESKAFSNITLMVNESKSSLNPFEGEKTANRNFTIYGGLFPYYMVVSVRIKKEIPSYLIMTSSLNPLPADVRINITDLIDETEELKNIHFYPVYQNSSANCKSYIETKVENPYRKLVKEKIEHITWSDATDTTDPTTTMNPPTTTKKPRNAASALFVSKFILLISVLFFFAH